MNVFKLFVYHENEEKKEEKEEEKEKKKETIWRGNKTEGQTRHKLLTFPG